MRIIRAKQFTALLLPLQFLLLLSCGGKSEPNARIGEFAPNFQYKLIDGETGSINDFRGKVVLVRYWADWCPYCRTEMPIIDSCYQRLREQGFIVLAVNVGQSEEVVEAFRAELNLHFPMALDPRGKIAKQYGVVIIPQNYLIDRSGVIREILSGEIFIKEAVLRNLLRPYFPKARL
jgi:peroxiredoxin